jgi:hypothetical protein
MLASPINWWDRSLISHDKVASAQLIKATNIDAIFAKDTVLRRLKQVLNFLGALGAGKFAAQAIKSPVTPRGRLRSQYPRMTLSQVWFKHASACCLEESAHPYKTRTMKKRVFIPNADKLIISFDRRCSLVPGAVLKITSGTFSYTLKGAFGEDSAYLKGVVIPGREVHLEFNEPLEVASQGGKVVTDAKPSGKVVETEAESELKAAAPAKAKAETKAEAEAGEEKCTADPEKASTDAASTITPDNNSSPEILLVAESEAKVASDHVIATDGAAARSAAAIGAAEEKPACKAVAAEEIGDALPDSQKSQRDVLVNATNEWGWAMVIQGYGDLYGSTSAQLVIDKSVVDTIVEKSGAGTDVVAESAAISGVPDSVAQTTAGLDSSAAASAVADNSDSFDGKDADVSTDGKVSADEVVSTSPTVPVVPVSWAAREGEGLPSTSIAADVDEDPVVSSAAAAAAAVAVAELGPAGDERPRTRRGLVEGVSPGDRMSMSAHSHRGAALTAPDLDVTADASKPTAAVRFAEPVATDAKAAPAALSTDQTATREDRIAKIVSLKGVVVSEGDLVVPHAYEVAVVIDRKNSKDVVDVTLSDGSVVQKLFVYVVTISYQKDDEG